jgi:hypothetical protein
MHACMIHTYIYIFLDFHMCVRVSSFSGPGTKMDPRIHAHFKNVVSVNAHMFVQVPVFS